MKNISLNKYGPIISDKSKGDEIYNLLLQNSAENDFVNIDLVDIKSMATFNAKQIFGQLYLKLGSNAFFDKIRFLNASDDLKLIIKIGIQNAIEDQTDSA